MMALLTTVSSGIDVVLHAGGILGSYLAFSFEKFVLDDEMCGMVRRFHEGIQVERDTLAYDLAAGVGIGGNYLAEDHTVQRCRTEFWRPELSDRGGLDAWMKSGRLSAVDRARQRWQKLVAKHQDPPLDALVARQLRAYIEEHGC
jgi:trimethylamine---corrinoid protein Co-methyltransferase